MNYNEISKLVSIIIPVYKVEAYIEECIESVINQSYPHIEIILVDDAGNDNSIELAEKKLNVTNCQWSILKHETNKGPSAARNTGIAAAKGEYLYFLDADDYIDRFCIEKLATAIVEAKAQMAYGGFAYLYQNRLVECKWWYPKTEVPQDSPFNLFLRRELSEMACNILIRKRFYIDCGISFDEGMFYEDAVWTFMMSLRTNHIVLTEGVTYYYRKNRLGSTTSAKRFHHHLIKSLYNHLERCSAEAEKFQIWNNVEFKMWYALVIMGFCERTVCLSTLPQNEKRDILDKVFKELRLPKEELQSLKKFRFARMFSFILPRYRWVWLIHWYNKLRAKLK